jgi:hypothetical protein
MSDGVDVKICVTGLSYQNLIIFANFVAGVNELNNQEYGANESEVQYYFLGIAEYAEFEKTYQFDNFHNITPNLSKYIPEDNAVLFLSDEDADKYCNFFPQRPCDLLSEHILKSVNYTIFLPHGTQSELQKAEELKEKYGVEEVNLFAKDWFYKNDNYDVISFLLYNKVFNKIITTNSTGILKHEDSNERLQVIDCKEIFEDCLKQNNL